MSTYSYTRPKLLEMASDVEKGAAEFYMALSKKFPTHKEIFQKLAIDEEEHAKRYLDLLKSVGQMPDIYLTREDHMLAEQNLKVLETSGVIANLKSAADHAKSIQDLLSAIQTAVQLERDSVVFYSGMAMALSEKDRNEIYKIIEVEHRHLDKVQRISV